MYDCIISLIFKITPLICLDSKTVSMITPISKPSSQENIGKKMWTVSFGEFPGCSLARRGSAGPVNTAVCCSTQCHMMPRKPILSSVIPLLFLRPSGLYALQCILSWHFSLEILISYFAGKKRALVCPYCPVGSQVQWRRQVFFQGHSCIESEMEGQEFLTEYRSISNKLKKRFLRFVANNCLSWPSSQMKEFAQFHLFS